MQRIFSLLNLTLLVLFLSLVCTKYVKDVSANTLFSDSFNKGRPESRYIKHGGCYPYSFQQKNGTLRIVNKLWEDNRNCSDWVGRPKTYKGNRYYTRRVELIPTSKNATPTYQDEFEWTFDLKFVKVPSTAAAMIFQVIPEPWKGVDIGLRVDRRNLWIHVIGKSKKVNSIKTGKWMTITIQFKRSKGSDGYVQLFIDNDLSFSHRGPTTKSSSNNAWAKFGIYNGQYHNGSDRSEFIIDFDDMLVERF
jgi:hypothetical protein